MAVLPESSGEIQCPFQRLIHVNYASMSSAREYCRLVWPAQCPSSLSFLYPVRKRLYADTFSITGCLRLVVRRDHLCGKTTGHQSVISEFAWS